MCCLSYTIPHSATALATCKGVCLRVAVRTEEPKILGTVVRGVAVDVIYLEDQWLAVPLGKLSAFTADVRIQANAQDGPGESRSPDPSAAFHQQFQRSRSASLSGYHHPTVR
jgi:hypothetical protein